MSSEHLQRESETALCSQMTPGRSFQVTVGSVSTSEVLQMVDRVKTLYAAHVPDIQEEVLNHQALAEEIQNPMNGDAAKKHLKQQVRGKKLSPSLSPSLSL